MRILWKTKKWSRVRGGMAVFLTLFLGCMCVGCSVSETDGERIKDLDYTVVEAEKIPEELAKQIEEKKASDFKLSYEDGEELYIVRGYGEQATGGYSIAVNEVYLTKNSIYFQTTLIGPEEAQETKKAPSFPYIVVKTDTQDKNIVFH